MKIYKYVLKLAENQAVNIHNNYKLLDIQIQNGCICLWAIVNANEPMVNVDIVMCGTGHELTESKKLNYISTVQQDSYVWHFFERRT